MTISHIIITQTHIEEVSTDCKPNLNKLTSEWIAKLVNKAIEIALAEESVPENTETYITTDEARKLGAWKVQFCHDDENSWGIASAQHIYKDSNKYRTIKQPEPEKQATVLRADFDFVMQDKQRAVKLIEDVYVLVWGNKMLEAKELPEKNVNNLYFDAEEQKLQAEWEAKKDTCDLWYHSDRMERAIWDLNVLNAVEQHSEEYELRTKPAKVVAWADVPVGVAVCDKKTNVVWLYQGGGDEKEALVTAPPNMPFGMRWIDLADLALAPAKNQPWIAYQGASWTIFENVKPLEDKGFIVESEEGRYRITGLAEGYEMEYAK